MRHLIQLNSNLTFQFQSSDWNSLFVRVAIFQEKNILVTVIKLQPLGMTINPDIEYKSPVNEVVRITLRSIFLS